MITTETKTGNLDTNVTEEFKVEEDGLPAFSVRSANPHGFYFIHLSRGQLPDELTGKYTSASGAINHAKAVFGKAKVK
jgi:hypothetical protein